MLMVVALYHLGIIGARNTAFGETGKIEAKFYLLIAYQEAYSHS